MSGPSNAHQEQMKMPQLPYFDFLFSELAKGNRTIEKSFGRHVHWGYWDDPSAAVCDDEDYALAAERLTLELCRLADIASGQRVLDVGCGFGGTVASLNERFRGLDLIGANIDERQLVRARELVKPANGNNVEFRQGDACSLPFQDASFDRLLAVECVFHFPSRETFFREANRVLRPGGVLVLSDFVPVPAFVPVSWLSTTRLFEKYNPFGICNVQYTVGRYRRLAARSGFSGMTERNVTLQTLPTYRYLKQILALKAGAHWLEPYLLEVLRLLSASGLLKYHFLSFQK